MALAANLQIKMGISRRHHYIPRFLIENFADSDGKVWVYNKEEGKVQTHKQSSKHIFFEWERNNFDVNGSVVDNIEQMYSYLDNFLAKNLKNVLATQAMKTEDLTMLIFLVSLIKWRIPASDEKFYKQFKDLPIDQLGIQIRPIEREREANKEELEKILELDFVKEVKRILISLQPLIRKTNLDTIHKNCFIVSADEIPSLLGDVPIIENPNSSFETLEDFIFPLSSTHSLICKRGAEKLVSNNILFYIQKDLTTFHLANKYVVCKSKEHLLKISTIYSTLGKEVKTDLMKKYLFSLIN